MARADKRQVSKEIRSIVRKGKESMYKWVVALGRDPSEQEIQAWQSGFIAGLNQNKD
jgi:hypothetical protein